MHSMLARLAAAFVALVALVACSSAAKPDRGSGAGLQSTTWLLVELGGVEVVNNDTHRAPYMVLEPKRRRFTGFAGVNRFAGTYSYVGSHLALTLGPMTLMAGSDDAMELESKFTAALSAVREFTLEGDRLTLLRDDRPLLVFRSN
ncbi:MAG: META domain-containing protein [Phycisphaerales bacterium]